MLRTVTVALLRVKFSSSFISCCLFIFQSTFYYDHIQTIGTSALVKTTEIPILFESCHRCDDNCNSFIVWKTNPVRKCHRVCFTPAICHSKASGVLFILSLFSSSVVSSLVRSFPESFQRVITNMLNWIRNSQCGSPSDSEQGQGLLKSPNPPIPTCASALPVNLCCPHQADWSQINN